MYEIFSQISNFLSQPFLNSVYSVKGTPVIFAFILGLIGALAPCQFTGNLGAITLYGNKSLQKGVAWKEAASFIIGKIIVFSGIGLVIWIIGKDFQQHLTIYFPWVRKSIGPMMILIGLYLLSVIKLKWTLQLGRFPRKIAKGSLGAFLMGVSFSLGFCPTMFTLFFVTLMPVVLTTSYGGILPSIFAIGTSIPLIFAIILIWSFGMDGTFLKKKGRKLGQFVQKAAGVIMILLGVLDTIAYWF